MNPVTGVRTSGGEIRGDRKLTFTPPFEGDAALYLSARGSSRRYR
jgi:hypothetical protein